MCVFGSALVGATYSPGLKLSIFRENLKINNIYNAIVTGTVGMTVVMRALSKIINKTITLASYFTEHGGVVAV